MVQTEDSEIVKYQKSHPHRIPNAMFVQLEDDYDKVVNDVST